MDDFQLDKTITNLLEFGDPALTYFTRRDLLGEDAGDRGDLQGLPEVESILAKQHSEGFWLYPGSRQNANPGEDYRILQTYRMLGELIERYGMDRSHHGVEGAAEFLFQNQSQEGDFRGIFANQYAPHYSAGILELLVKAGYQDDRRVESAFNWFEGHQQNEGGWAWPLRTAGVKYQDAVVLDHPLQPEPSKPFSHALTGFVIRPFAVHPVYRESPLAVITGELLKSRFFQPDKYSDRRAASYWLKFQYPYWWGNLLTALDSLSRIGFSASDTDIQLGLEWFQAEQLENGFWPTGYGSGKGAERNQAWVALAVCRMLKGFTG